MVASHLQEYTVLLLMNKCYCLLVVKVILGTGNVASSSTHHAQLLTHLILQPDIKDASPC